MRLCRRAGARMQADPARRDVSQAFQQIRKGFCSYCHVLSLLLLPREPVTEYRQAVYFCRSLSRNRLLSAVTSHAFGQKQRSTHHQSLGTPAFISSGMSFSKFNLPVPNGLCVLVLWSLSVPSESIRWIC